MKTSFGLLLILPLIIAGCSPGYNAAGPAYREPPPTKSFFGTSFVNPETEEERSMRIWREEASR